MITKYNRLMFLLLFLASSIIINSQTILYVTQNGAGTKDGSSWSNALSEVADALKYAKQNETQWTETNTLQIWVAKGTYKPLYDPADNNFGNIPTAANARDVSFLLVNNVQLYGGFAGTETSLTARNWNTNKTILSGDIGAANDISDNAYNVVISFGKSATEPITRNTVLDGFTIMGGNANNNTHRTINGRSINREGGGGMYNNSSTLTLTNVTISGNKGTTEGGGMYNNNSSPILTNVTISGNAVIFRGGGMFNNNSSPTLTNVTLSGNRAREGGGMYGRNASKPKIYNSIILGNNTAGIYNQNKRRDVPDIQYSLVQDLENTDNGNISAKDVKATDIFENPVLTVTASGPTTNGDYSLKKNNVVINKGDNSLYDATKYGDKDLAGNPRMYNGGVIDLGAYEYQGTLSVSDLNSNKEVKTMVYPNPTTGVFFVKTDKESKAVLYDLSGKLLKTISLKKGENQIDISHLTKGMYLLKTENGTFKVIKR